MRNILKRISGPFLRIYAKYYFAKPRKYSFKNINGVVLPGVFFPFLTISTRLLLVFIEPMNLEKKTFLELGCGTGMISVLAAKNGAQVTASDINPKAIENVRRNAFKNDVPMEIILSDLFNEITPRTFDYIVINPPYYPKNPETHEEAAWFCGEHFEYFEKLFSSLPPFIHSESKVFMCLSEDCALDTIQGIAHKNELDMKKILTKKVWGEENFIFEITK